MSNLASGSTRTNGQALTDGIRLGAGPGAATFVLGLAFGAAASAAGWGGAVPLVFSVLACSGSAQFTLLATLPAGAVAAVAAAVLINARYFVMSVALNDSLRGGRVRRALQAQALLDASFAAGHRGNGRFDVARLVGASIPQWMGWVSGTAAGLLAAPSAHLMHALGTDVALPAFFLMLALDELGKSRRAIIAAVLGASIAAALLFVTSPGNALMGATAAALAGAVRGPQRSAREGH
ncbi:MAG TPA: AzlC family ABC transporter permease [Trebonia sp.]|nr:AzlC family ABC transporter permease [Trebonia sp.]